MVRAGERTGALVSAPLILCAHWTLPVGHSRLLQKKETFYNSCAETCEGIMSISGIISHFLWENQFRTLNKRYALVLCSVQGLDFDLTLPLFSCTIPLKAYRACQRASSVWLQLARGQAQLFYLWKRWKFSFSFSAATASKTAAPLVL